MSVVTMEWVIIDFAHDDRQGREGNKAFKGWYTKLILFPIWLLAAW